MNSPPVLYVDSTDALQEHRRALPAAQVAAADVTAVAEAINEVVDQERAAIRNRVRKPTRG
jgi:precorrin isomerase